MPVKKTTRKAAASKPAKRKTAVKKAAKSQSTAGAAKKKVAKSVVKPAAVKVVSEKLTASQLYTMIGERTALSRKQVSSVFEELAVVMEACLKKRGIGEFALPKLCKFVVKNKPATKARKGINPFTGAEIMIKAKPARRVVKVRPLKKVKEMAD